MTKQPHLLLIGNYRPDQEESMQRYAAMLASHLPLCGFKVSALHPPVVAGRLACGSTALAKFLGYVDKLILFPFQLRRFLARAAQNQPVDLVHLCDNGNAFYVPAEHRTFPRPLTLITCHDFFALNGTLGLTPGVRPRFTGRLLQRYTLRGLRRADHFLCVSEATRGNLLRLPQLLSTRPQDRTLNSQRSTLNAQRPTPCASSTPLNEGGAVLNSIATTISNGLAENFAAIPGDAAEKIVGALHPALRQQPRGYVFHLGNNHWYKNREFVLETYFELCRRSSQPPPLVLAGMKLTGKLAAQLAARPENATVLELGRVDDTQLAALYTNAGCLFFPSLAEGFGWPILEAMACGCPVITSNRVPMAEIAGDAAILADPKNISQLADALVKVVHLSAGERSAMTAGGLRQVAHFSVERMIEETAQLYRTLLSRRDSVESTELSARPEPVERAESLNRAGSANGPRHFQFAHLWVWLWTLDSSLSTAWIRLSRGPAGDAPRGSAFAKASAERREPSSHA